MTTGRINQVCQMLPKSKLPHGTMALNGSAAKMQLFASHNSALNKETLPSKRNLQLDANKLHISTIIKKALMQQQPARTQSLCVIKQNQYPISFNDHKETRWQAKRQCHCTNSLSNAHQMFNTNTRSPETGKKSE